MQLLETHSSFLIMLNQAVPKNSLRKTSSSGPFGLLKQGSEENVVILYVVW